MTPRTAYALFVGLGALVCFWIRYLESKRLGYSKHPSYRWVGLGSLLGAVVGAKLSMVFYLTWREVPELFFDVLHFDFSGKSILGALFGGYLGGEIAKAITGIRFSTGDALAIALPVAQAIGRWGCFFAGCCYGTEHEGALSIFQHGASRHPVAIYESMGCALIAIIVFAARQRIQTPGRLFELYLILYFALRFVLEFLRGDAVPMGFLTGGQLLCVVGILFASWRSWSRGGPIKAPQPAEL